MSDTGRRVRSYQDSRRTERDRRERRVAPVKAGDNKTLEETFQEKSSQAVVGDTEITNSIGDSSVELKTEAAEDKFSSDAAAANSDIVKTTDAHHGEGDVALEPPGVNLLGILKQGSNPASAPRVSLPGVSVADLEQMWQQEEQTHRQESNNEAHQVDSKEGSGEVLEPDDKGQEQRSNSEAAEQRSTKGKKDPEAREESERQKKSSDGQGKTDCTELADKQEGQTAQKEQNDMKHTQDHQAVNEGQSKEEEVKTQQNVEEELKQVQEYVVEVQEKLALRTGLRKNNLSAQTERPDETYFSKLDSSLKKNTAFVKKLKTITDSQKKALTKDFNSLNLSRYLGEMAAAFVEAKLKMSDVPCVLHLCSLAHQRYAEFSGLLLDAWSKVLLSKKDDKVPNPSKLRVDLRLFADLVAVGVFPEREGLTLLASQLTQLVALDKETHNNLSIFISFCRHCTDDYAGLIPRRIRELSEKHELQIPRSTWLAEERKKGCRNLLIEYFNGLQEHLLKDCKDMRSAEKLNRKILQTKGELSQERQDRYDGIVQAFQKLHQNSSQLADLLDREPLQLPPEELPGPDDDPMSIDLFNPLRDGEGGLDGDGALFEDEDTRLFYEHLQDLKAFVPQILYKDSEKPTLEVASDGQDNEVVDIAVEDVEQELAETKEDTEEQAPPELEAEEDTDIGASMKLILESFLSSLPNCVNRDLIDKAATDFCMNLNTKVNRRKLLKAIFTVHRTRYDLLPFYSRLVATLHPCMPDLSTELAEVLKKDFKWHVRKKDQINIESKLKTVRFIGELVKFKMFPKSEAMHCLKMLLFDFSHHNIEMACSLLETCGRFLYRSPDSHNRTRVYLEVMMRKHKALHLDQRYSAMIENAFYYCNPPEVKAEEQVKLPPIQQYIQKLLFVDLNKINIEKVLRHLRKIHWEDNEMARFATKCLTSVWLLRYNAIHCCASVLAGLTPYHEDVAIRVVDNILEEIRLGLEVNHPKLNQRRVSCIKYLGELYNYRLVESSVIFKTLYTLITFGVSTDESIPSLLDPPEHLFRIRLVCTLLETCGVYFDRGSSRKKLDCFLTYFQRYFWFKRSLSIWSPDTYPFPLEIEHCFRDTVEKLRTRMEWTKNYEEAKEAVEVMEKEFKAKIAEQLKLSPQQQQQQQEDEQSLRDSEDGELHAISEQDEHGSTEDLSQSRSQGHLDVDHSQDSDGVPRSRRNQREDEEEDEISDHDYLDNVSDMNSHDEDEDMETVTGGPKHMACAEDDAFLAQFDKMLTENIQARNQESIKVPQADIAVPVNVASQKPKYYTPGEECEEQELENTVTFTLMTRKGNKPQFSNLAIPATESFAANFNQFKEAERREKERMKQVVLNIHDRQEEEDYQEMLASVGKVQVAGNTKERKPRYQHPKGAPDADYIFGSRIMRR